MTNMEVLVKSIDCAIWELGEAFSGLQDEDLWKRPSPEVLSVGELAAHCAYGEIQAFMGGDLESPLNTSAAEYYPHTVATPFSLPMTADEVFSEIKRVHEACKASILSEPKEYEDQNPWRADWTWGYSLIYIAFHYAYHTGQMYSVRHLLGHETADN